MMASAAAVKAKKDTAYCRDAAWAISGRAMSHWLAASSMSMPVRASKDATWAAWAMAASRVTGARKQATEYAQQQPTSTRASRTAGLQRRAMVAGGRVDASVMRSTVLVGGQGDGPPRRGGAAPANLT